MKSVMKAYLLKLLFVATTFLILLSVCSSSCTLTNNVEVEVSITTDDYPEEISWNIINVIDPNSELMSGSGYTETGTTYIFSDDLVPCEDYIFIISDSYGDGICCESGEGSYTVTVDGKVVAEGGEFSSSEETEFSIDADASFPSEPSNQPTKEPTRQPIRR